MEGSGWREPVPKRALRQPLTADRPVFHLRFPSHVLAPVVDKLAGLGPRFRARPCSFTWNSFGEFKPVAPGGPSRRGTASPLGPWLYRQGGSEGQYRDPARNAGFWRGVQPGLPRPLRHETGVGCGILKGTFASAQPPCYRPGPSESCDRHDPVDS